jgi:hypothetical protein
LKEILPANQVFEGVELHIFSPIGLFISVEENHVTLKRKACVLEAGVCSTLFLREN